MTRVGVVTALKAEMRCFGKGHPAEPGLILLRQGTWVKLSGIGAEAAGLASKSLLKKGATSLVSFGFAGGLQTALRPGHLALPKKIISCQNTDFYAAPKWHDRLYENLAAFVDLHTGPLLQSSTVLTSPKQKSAAFEKYGASAVDMESGAVAEAAKEAKRPFVCVKAILDPVEMSLPETALAATDTFGELRPLHFLLGLMRRPGHLFHFIRLARNLRKARANLCKVIDQTDYTFLAP